MDVSCSQCGTEYEFDETLVSDVGTTVKCQQCGYVFKVFRTTDGSQAGHVAPWTVRLPSGILETVKSMRDLQRGITEGHFPETAEITRSGSAWKRLGDIAELETFFAAAAASLSQAAPLNLAAPGRVTPPPPFSRAPSVAPPRPSAPVRGPSRTPTLRPSAIVPAPSVPVPLNPLPAQSKITVPEFAESELPRGVASPAHDDVDAPTNRLPSSTAQPPHENIWDTQTTSFNDEETVVGGGAGASPSRGLYVDDDDAEAEPPRVERTNPLWYSIGGLAVGLGIAAVAMSVMGKQSAKEPEKKAPNAIAASAPTLAPQPPAEPSRAAEAQVIATTPDPVVAAPATARAALVAQPVAQPVARAAAVAVATPTQRPSSEAPAAGPAPAHDFDYYVEHGRSLMESGNARGARPLFEAALRLKPNDPAALVGLGWVAANSEHFNEAIDHFRAAQDGNSEAFIGLGQVYRSLGRKDDALQAYRNYLSKSASGTYAAMARTWIERLSENP